MHDGVSYMMYYLNQHKINKHHNKIIKHDNKLKPCIKRQNSNSKNKHVTFKGEWCTFFRFMYN